MSASGSDSERTEPQTGEASTERDGTGEQLTGDTEAETERLRVENERLRREYDRTRQVEYGRTAIGLAVVGLVALAGAVTFPVVRDVLVITGAIGLFAAVLTRFLTPERFLPVDVAEGIYDSVAESRRDLVAELGLTGDPLYVPIEDGGTVRLFVPQYDGMEVPDTSELQSTLVVPGTGDDRGITFTPSGATLFREFERTLQEPLADSSTEAAFQLSEGLSDGLELVDPGSVHVERHSTGVSLEVTDPPFGRDDRIDHPIVSFVGVGLAVVTDAPVTIADVRTDDDRLTVTYTWQSEAEVTEEVDTSA